MYSLSGIENPTCLEQWRQFFEPLLEDPINVGQPPLTWNLLVSRPDGLEHALEGLNEKARELIVQNWRILCLSTHNDLLLMWAHYADRHRGICLEFDAALPNMGEAFEVIYRDQRPVIDCRLLRDFTTRTASALLTKSSHWSYEQEYRILARTGENDTEPTLSLRKTNSDYYDLMPGSLTGIIAGSRADFATIQAIVREHKPSVNLYRAKQFDLEYKVLVERVAI